MSTITKRIDALESSIGRIENLLLQAIEGAPKATRKGKARKATTKKAAPKADVTVRHLVRKNRPAFVKAHPWAAGLSTSQIAEAVVSGTQSCESGWAIGERRTAMVEAKAPKAKTTKRTKRVVAEVKADAPAKAADAPRNARGHITPRSEWALRENLAETGKFDRHEIDAIVASQA